MVLLLADAEEPIHSRVGKWLQLVVHDLTKSALV